MLTMKTSGKGASPGWWVSIMDAEIQKNTRSASDV
jgi:hypothetical protein